MNICFCVCLFVCLCVVFGFLLSDMQAFHELSSFARVALMMLICHGVTVLLSVQFG